MEKIVFIEPLGISNEELRVIISDYINEVDISFYDDKPKNKRDLIERVKDATIIVTAQVVIDKEVIDSCDKLRYICVAFTGTDHIDKKYCKQKDIKVSNCSGYSTVAVSELVFALVLNLMRNISKCDKATRESKTKDGLIGEELEGKTFGIIGLGEIGSRVAKIANCFGCKVIAYSRHDKYLENVKQVTLEEVLKESDILSLHVPSNESTYHMIGKEQLELMKSNSILINCARGAVVDNVALKQALDKGIIAGCGIDVFDSEPPLDKDYCLLSAKNCLLTPHIGFATKQAFVKRAHIVADNLKAYLNGEIINEVED